MVNFVEGNAQNRRGGQTDYQGEESAFNQRVFNNEPSKIKNEYAAPEPVPFNGPLINKLLTALPGPDLSRLLPHLEPVALHPFQDVYKFGERVEFVYFPETAVISHLYFLADGSTTGAAIIGREGMLGLSAIFNSPPPTYLTRVIVGGSALRTSTSIIKKEFQRSGLLHQLLLRYTNTRLAQLSQRAVCNGRHRLDERLCTWLLMILDRASDESLPLTHEEIAHHLGARRAGITTFCNQLRELGALDYRRGMINILDRQKLEMAACECYQTLKQVFEQSLY